MKVVCVTGASGYLGSSLLKKLLERGYTVHATLRNLGDESKVGILKRLENAWSNLKLFEADIYNGEEFEKAIEGCEFVVHMATPLQHYPHNSQYKNITEAAVGGLKKILESCIKSRTVKKVIYTSSIAAASPLEQDGIHYKDSMDESCWTPLNIPYAFANPGLTDYVHSKTLSEKEVLSYNNENNVKVVSLVCGLVGGDTRLSLTSQSNAAIVSPIVNINSSSYQNLKFLEELSGKIPIIHVEDVHEAHIFCMENSSTNGRFILSDSFVSSAEITNYYQNLYPDIHIDDKVKEDKRREICLKSTKLKNEGFEYKYDTKMILDDSINFAKKMNQFI